MVVRPGAMTNYVCVNWLCANKCYNMVSLLCTYQYLHLHRHSHLSEALLSAAEVSSPSPLHQPRPLTANIHSRHCLFIPEQYNALHARTS